MRSLHSFIIKPLDGRYNNEKKVGDSTLVLNTEVQDHSFVSRIGEVLETPVNEKTDIKKGDQVIVHHNIFRRFYDVRGNEKNSSSYFEEDKYFVFSDQIFMYKRNEEWKPLKGFCFVKPVKNRLEFSNDKEEPLVGVLKFLDNDMAKNGFKKGDIVGFTKDSEYEFVIDNSRLYRVPTNSICIKYGHKGNEEEYYRSWETRS